MFGFPAADGANTQICMRVIKTNTCVVASLTLFFSFQLAARNDDLPLAHVAIAVEGPGWNSKDNVALSLANTIISSYDVTYGGGKVRLNINCLFYNT